MASVVDAFVLEFGLDPSKFHKDAEEVERALNELKNRLQHQGSELERMAKNVGYSIESVSTGLKNLFGVYLSVGGFKKMVEDVTEATAALGRFSQIVDLAPERISSFQNTMRLFGVSMEESRRVIDKMSKDMMQWRLHGSPPDWAKWFGRYKISLRPEDDPLLKLDELHKRFSELGLKAGEVRIPLQDMGASTAAFVDAMVAKESEWENHRKRVAGTELSEKEVAAGIQLKEDFGVLSASAFKLGTTIVTHLEPAMHDVLKDTNNLIKSFDELVKKFGSLNEAINVTIAQMLDPYMRSLFGSDWRGLVSVLVDPGPYWANLWKYVWKHRHISPEDQKALEEGLNKNYGPKSEIKPEIAPDRFKDTPPSTNLQDARQKLSIELDDPAVNQQLWDLAEAEVGGQGGKAKQAFVEEVFNRALFQKKSLRQIVNDRQYFPDSIRKIESGRIHGYPDADVLKTVLGGSNITSYATGNASQQVGFGWGTTHGGETLDLGTGGRFGIEKKDYAAVEKFKRQEEELSKADDYMKLMNASKSNKSTGLENLPKDNETGNLPVIKNNNIQSESNFSNVTVNSQATDVPGMVDDIQAELKRRQMGIAGP